MTQDFSPTAAAELLLAARKGAASVRWRDVMPPGRDAAFATQFATVLRLGAIGGWKVGASSLEAEPSGAPLPAAGILKSGVTLIGPPWTMRGVELEVAVRLGKDLESATPPATARIVDAIEAVLPVIEVVETRLADWKDSDPLAQVADLHTHGALVLGPDSDFDPAALDLRTLEAYLAFDDQPVASTRGGNTAVDIWRELGWLAAHCTRLGHPLRAGTVITTGSCTGMLFAPEGAHVHGQLKGIGEVELRF